MGDDEVGKQTDEAILRDHLARGQEGRTQNLARLGTFLFDAGRYSEGVPYLQEGCYADDSDEAAVCCYELGLAYALTRIPPDTAFELLERVIAIAPSSSVARSARAALGAAYYNSGDYVTAISLLRDAQQSPEGQAPGFRLMLGLALAAVGEVDDAERLLIPFAEAENDEWVGLSCLGLAKIAQRRGNLAEARRLLSHGIEVTRDSNSAEETTTAELTRYLASLVAAEDAVTAERLLRDTYEQLARRPANADPIIFQLAGLDLGDLLAREGRWSEAAEIFRAVELSPVPQLASRASQALALRSGPSVRGRRFRRAGGRPRA